MHHRTRDRIATALDSTRAQRTRSPIVIALVAASTVALAAGPATPRRFAAEDVLPNDNRIGAPEFGEQGDNLGFRHGSVGEENNEETNAVTVTR